MKHQDPPRLLDGKDALEPELRSLLQAGHQELPSQAQLSSLAERLGPTLGPAPTLQLAKAPATGGIAPLLVPGFAVLGLLFLGAVGLQVGSRPPSQAVPRPVAHTAGAADEAPAVAVRPPVPQPVAAAKPAESQPPSVTPSGVAAKAHPKSSGVSGPARRVRRADATAELTLLDAAHRALGDDPGRALALTRTHRTRFPRGHYVQEREMIAIEALMVSERLPQARARARGFIRRFPGSSHVRRLRELLAQPTP